MPVFLVRVSPSPMERMHCIRYRFAMQMPAVRGGLEMFQMGPKPGDFVITTHSCRGAFYGTKLHLEFRRRGSAMVAWGISTTSASRAGAGSHTSTV